MQKNEQHEGHRAARIRSEMWKHHFTGDVAARCAMRHAPRLRMSTTDPVSKMVRVEPPREWSGLES
jgi:hypothetical protein